RHTDDQLFDLFPCRRPTGATPRTTVIFIGDQFPVPGEQCLWRPDGCHFRQHLSSEQPGLDCQTAALVVSEAKPPAAELNTKDSVFLAQILDRVLLLLIHPACNCKEQKAERIQCLRHRFSSLTFSHLCCRPSPFRLRFQEVPVFGYYDSQVSHCPSCWTSQLRVGLPAAASTARNRELQHRSRFAQLGAF